jgi:hypothetical protein
MENIWHISLSSISWPEAESADHIQSFASGDSRFQPDFDQFLAPQIIKEQYSFDLNCISDAKAPG